MPHSEEGHRPAPPEAARGDDETLRIWGIHAVEAALRNPKRAITELQLTDNAENRLADALATRMLKPKRTSPRDLDRLLGADTVHQGACAIVEALAEPTLHEVVERARSGGPLVVLDQVTDPHNVGAILRSAAVFGASALLMTRRHSPPLAGALAKVASGALEVVPIVLVPNLARALDELGEAGVRRIGLDGEGEQDLEAEAFEAPAALVLGSEGKGLRRLTREHCDTLARIGAAGALASLNVSNAAAVALFAAKARRSSRA